MGILGTLQDHKPEGSKRLKDLPLFERRAISSKLTQHRSRLIEAAAETLQHRFGAQAFTHPAVEGAGSPIDFLAAAIELGSVASFGAYTAWMSRVLIARFPIEPHSSGMRAVQVRFEALEAPLAVFFTPGERAIIRSYLDAAISSLRTAEQTALSPRLAESRAAYLDEILRGNRREAYEVARRLCTTGTSLQDVYTYVLAEAQHELGRRWEGGKLGEAHEHEATSITQYVMAQLSVTFGDVQPIRGTVMVGAVPGENHDVGASMISELLRFDGWNVRFLGASAPLESIVRKVSEIRPVVAGFSITMLTNIRVIQNLVFKIKEQMGEDAPKIVLGGAAVRLAPGFACEVGADGIAVDAHAALELFRSFGPAVGARAGENL